MIPEVYLIPSILLFLRNCSGYGFYGLSGRSLRESKKLLIPCVISVYTPHMPATHCPGCPLFAA